MGTIKQAAIANLCEIKGILDQLAIPFWLDGGTLLGAYRDHDFCVGDEDDIDLCTWMELKTDAIVRQAKRHGFSVYGIWETEFALTRDGNKVDLFFNAKKGDEAYTWLYLTGQPRVAVVIPLHFYEQLEPIEFHGMWFERPREIEEYLAYKYGPGWRTPIPRSEYTYYSAKSNRVVRPGWQP